MNRKRCELCTVVLFVFGCGLFGSAACSTEDIADLSGRDRGTPEQQGPVVVSDAEIAAVVSAVNASEMRRAQVALQSAQLPAVLDFARAMLHMHSEAEQRQSAFFAQLGISPRQNPVSAALVADATAFTASFSASDGSFDRKYILTEIKAHSSGLSLIDEQLLPRAQSPEVRAELERFRATVVAAHLASAEQVLRSMGR
ncbi:MULTISPECIES: DUF4142 domain-containing protein [Sorangium]|uniref:DUF4142 domain-containing protein n=1 Tax=Sorangium cellulosum TaxID=56 RepID=A0A4P2QX45_SORCE|nr:MULTISPECIES: DUF4142 domain-containing protein [Sorangium]AUX35005.1 uncharacterized protein SOCE836_071930 [Sorangium cellulosum]WCQ94311.1 hypothetical protein NQZ70_07076 [Sorangium sp. Soce836]